MATRARSIVLALAAALAVFAVVQDRVTAAGARGYVSLQRAALAENRPPIRIDEVMPAAVARSVRLGLGGGGAVLLVGLVHAASRPERGRRE